MPDATTVEATFLFADIAGFTALTEAHGDHDAAALVADFCRSVRAELPASGGTEVKTIGDAVMLTIPDPAAAIRLGLRITHELMRGHGAPAVRVGLHHGPAVERDGDYFGAPRSPLAADPRDGRLDDHPDPRRHRAAWYRRPRLRRPDGPRARRDAAAHRR